MPWNIPDKGTAQNNFQSRAWAEYFNILFAGLAGQDFVLSGCAVTAQGSPDMTVAVAKGAVLSNGVLRAVTAGNVTISAAHSTNPRIDLVVVDSSGAKQVRTGTAAATPAPPARTANDVVLAAVYVPATDTTISTDQIVDLRVLVTAGPTTIAKTTSPVSFNNTNAAQTYLSVVLPSGLFLSGKTLRVRCGGNYLSNSGTGTWTLTIAYGGTTLFADATGATTADADRGAWYLEFELVAQSNTSQKLSGLVSFQTPGAKTAPTTGTAGDLGATTHVNTPLAGTASVDSDAADRTLSIQWTMSVANAAVETVMEFATVELV